MCFMKHVLHIKYPQQELSSGEPSFSHWSFKGLYSKRLKSLHGSFQHHDLSGLLYSYPNKFPHSSPEAPRIIQMHETSTSEGGNYSPQFCQQICNLQESTRVFYMPQSWDMGRIILLPHRRKAYWGFFGCPKNPKFGRVWTRELGFQWPVC
jgi:hypothetical protein